MQLKMPQTKSKTCVISAALQSKPSMSYLLESVANVPKLTTKVLPKALLTVAKFSKLPLSVTNSNKITQDNQASLPIPTATLATREKIRTS